MSAVADDEEFVIEQGFLFHVIGGCRMAHGAADHQIDIAVAQCDQQLAIRRFTHFYRCTRMLLRESRPASRAENTVRAIGNVPMLMRPPPCLPAAISSNPVRNSANNQAHEAHETAG